MSDFRPPAWIANRHLQSVLPSLPFRRMSVERRARAVLAASKPLVLDCGEGVRLLGLHAAPAPGAESSPRRLAVLLHGWEGSADSLYLISVAGLLHARGFDVLRLNLRDHGGTHALNRELFHSCRLPEVVGAVACAARLFPTHRLMLAGFSLGANFCLRVGAKARAAGIR
ncbi:MAG: alpha/beta fold hydrolase, partial [Steroidobacteraceae bacterium]